MTHYLDRVNRVMDDVRLARIRGHLERGVQRNSLAEWYVILGEEFGELAQALQAMNNDPWVKPTDKQDAYAELIDIMRVAIQMAEQIQEERDHARTDQGGTIEGAERNR